VADIGLEARDKVAQKELQWKTDDPVGQILKLRQVRLNITMLREFE